MIFEDQIRKIYLEIRQFEEPIALGLVIGFMLAVLYHEAPSGFWQQSIWTILKMIFSWPQGPIRLGPINF